MLDAPPHHSKAGFGPTPASRPVGRRRCWREALLGIFAGGIAAGAVAAGAPRLPASIEVTADDVATARAAFERMLVRAPRYTGEALQAYVAAVGTRIAGVAPRANVTFRFTVLDSPGIFAFSYADGQVVISRGMLAHLESEAELAAVFGHEIGHVTGLHQARIAREARRAAELQARIGARFSSEQAREALGTLAVARVRGYSRENELEADAWGEELLRRAGYPAGSTARMLRFLVQYDAFVAASGFQLWEVPDDDLGGGVFSTHPSPAARLDAAIARDGEAGAARDAGPDPDYLARLQDLEFGIPRRYGTQRGEVFVFAARDLALTLPAGWYVFGNAGEVIAAAPDNLSLLRLNYEARPEGQSPREALLAMGADARLTLLDAPAAHLEAAVAEVPAAGREPSALLAVVDVGPLRVRCRGAAATPETWVASRQALLGIVASVRAPTAAEAALEPLRVTVSQTAGAGLLAPAPGDAGLPRAQLEILNHLFPDAPAPAGYWVKRVR